MITTFLSGPGHAAKSGIWNAKLRTLFAVPVVIELLALVLSKLLDPLVA